MAEILFPHTARLHDYFCLRAVAILGYHERYKGTVDKPPPPPPESTGWTPEEVVSLRKQYPEYFDRLETHSMEFKLALQMCHNEVDQLSAELAPTGHDFGRLVGEVRAAIEELCQDWVPTIGADSPAPDQSIQRWWSLVEGCRVELGIRLDQLRALSVTKPAGEGGGDGEPVAGEWLTSTSKADMANRLGNIDPRKVKSLLNSYGLKQAGNRQLWTCRLDKMPKNIREKLEKPK